MTTFGYTSFCTADWVPLTKVMLESFLEYSKYDITVNCVNFEWKIDHPRVKTKTLLVDRLDRMNLFRQKWVSALNCDYDVSLLIESDMIANKDVDDIYEKNAERIATSKFPLFCKHPHNPFSPITCPLGGDLRNFISNFCSNKPKMNYVYANCLFHRNNNRWLFDELISWLTYCSSKNIHIPCEDEGMLNALLTNHQLDYDIGFNYLPNTPMIEDYIRYGSNTDVSDELRDAFVKKNCSVSFDLLDPDARQSMMEKMKSDCPIRFNIFHGCKNPTTAFQFFQQLKSYHTQL